VPVSEVLFVSDGPGYWPIVTYDAKWRPGSRDYEATPPQYPADVDPRLAKVLGKIAGKAFRLLGCRDYARCDFRVRPSGEPYLLEVNPNPDFNDLAGLAGSLKSAGLTHAEFTKNLVKMALLRGGASNGMLLKPSQAAASPNRRLATATKGSLASVKSRLRPRRKQKVS
jgi:D-alanine-D-alanine ligase